MELSLFAMSSLVTLVGFAFLICMADKKEPVKKPVKIDKRLY